MRQIVLGGRFGERSQDRSDFLVATFAERGGEWIETAHSYADGAAEQSVAAAIAAAGRPLRVVTKVGHPDPDGAPTLDPRSLARQLAVSADRLQRPIDAVLLHRDDPTAHPEQLLAPLLDARSVGLITHLGVANWSLDRAIMAQRLAGPLWAISLQLSVVTPGIPMWEGTRSASPADVLWADEAGVSLLAWSPLARGWIPDPGSAPAEAQASFTSVGNWRILERCDEIAAIHGCSRSAVALAWLLSAGRRIRPIVGAESLQDLDEAYQAVRLVRGADQTRLTGSLALLPTLSVSLI